jgi:hypothetical protein
MVSVVNKGHDELRSKKNALEIVYFHLQEYECHIERIDASTEQEAMDLVLVEMRLLDESTSK